MTVRAHPIHFDKASVCGFAQLYIHQPCLELLFIWLIDLRFRPEQFSFSALGCSIKYDRRLQPAWPLEGHCTVSTLAGHGALGGGIVNHQLLCTGINPATDVVVCRGPIILVRNPLVLAIDKEHDL